MDFLAGLNPQQREAAAHVEGPLLILAGAGSGKDSRHHAPDRASDASRTDSCATRLLAVTFTNKAAEEMRKRIESAAREGRRFGIAERLHVSLVLRPPAAARRRPARRDPSRISRGSSRSTTTTISSRSSKASTARSASTRSSCSIARRFRASATRRTSSRRRRTSTKTRPIRKWRGWPSSSSSTKKRLLRSNALDFDDLLLETVRLLRHDAELRDIYNEPHSIPDDRRVSGHEPQPV